MKSVSRTTDSQIRDLKSRMAYASMMLSKLAAVFPSCLIAKTTVVIVTGSRNPSSSKL